MSNKEITNLTEAYLELFGTIPCILNFKCTKEEYLEAMWNAVKDGKSLERILPPAQKPFKANAECDLCLCPDKKDDTYKYSPETEKKLVKNKALSLVGIWGLAFVVLIIALAIAITVIAK